MFFNSTMIEEINTPRAFSPPTSKVRLNPLNYDRYPTKIQQTTDQPLYSLQ